MGLKQLLKVVILGMLPAAALAQGGDNWGQWRGPNFNGSTSATDLPDALDKDKPLWVTPMPGHGNGTPVIWGDRVFTTASEDGSMKLLAICLNKADGKILWQKEVGQGMRRNQQGNHFATPSPVTDGQRVIFLYGNGDLVSFDMNGAEQWRRNIQKDHGKWNIQWVYGSSPLLFGGKLYVPVVHRNVPTSNWGNPSADDKLAESFILAIDPGNGQDLWRVARPTDAQAESQESYATPIPWEYQGKTEILMTGGDCVTAHDPQTGKEIWRAGGWNPEKVKHWRLVPSAVTWNGLVYTCPPKGGQILAWKGGGQGDVTGSHLAWKGNGLTSDVAVPLVYKDHLYVLDGDRPRRLSCVDPKTGQVKWAGSFESRSILRGSPTGADGKIYCTSQDGEVFVATAGPAGGFKQLSKTSLGSEFGPTRSSVAAINGMIVLRTGDKVWAFGRN